MDPVVCRESLATLLAQETAALDELAKLLEHEHALIVANDIEGLDEAMQRRQETMSRLLNIEN